MLTPDRFQLLAVSAQISVVVLANADVTDIELVPIRPHSISDGEISRRCAGRDMHFAGVLGIVNGAGHAQLDEPLDERRVSALAQAFSTYCAVLMGESWERQRAEIETECLNRMYAREVSRGEH